jgi:peptidoglycan/LPS O-acetylase OafA/YrhL
MKFKRISIISGFTLSILLPVWFIIVIKNNMYPCFWVTIFFNVGFIIGNWLLILGLTSREKQLTGYGIIGCMAWLFILLIINENYISPTGIVR